MEWISVKDRLPEKDGQYLCFTVDKLDHAGDEVILTFSLNPNELSPVFDEDRKPCWVDFDTEVGFWEVKNVTHWLPIPEPPKEFLALFQ